MIDNNERPRLLPMWSTAVMFSLLAFTAAAEDAVPFPQLDTKAFCTALVSKMLDPSEKQVENEKCLKSEEALKEAIQPYWALVPIRTQKFIITNYLTEARHQTYTTVSKFVGLAVGEACMNKRLICRAP